jgi:hypothetical protein
MKQAVRKTCFVYPSNLKIEVFPPTHLRMETDPVSETLCFLVPRIPDDGKSPKTQ